MQVLNKLEFAKLRIELTAVRQFYFIAMFGQFGFGATRRFCRGDVSLQDSHGRFRQLLEDLRKLFEVDEFCEFAKAMIDQPFKLQYGRGN